MNSVYIDIFNKKAVKNTRYDRLLVTESDISRVPSKKNSQPKLILPDIIYACGDFCDKKSKKKVISIYIDGILAHYIIQELKISPNYRQKLINIANSFSEHVTNILIWLVPAQKEIIDYEWNYRTTNLAWERLELDHTLSWLSTLGGAFSALGDYFENCALMAGKISYHQLQLAIRLGDPNVAARCRLYLSLSLIQRGYLKQAKRIIYMEYLRAKNDIVVDYKLINMCSGIWAKLQYEYQLKKIK